MVIGTDITSINIELKNVLIHSSKNDLNQNNNLLNGYCFCKLRGFWFVTFRSSANINFNEIGTRTTVIYSFTPIQILKSYKLMFCSGW